MLKCWASLNTARAVAYRAHLGATDAAMGVTVQKMVDAEVSGVMFTCNPVSGDPSMVAVNASWGLGLAVVGGETKPDDFLVSKVTGESSVGDQREGDRVCRRPRRPGYRAGRGAGRSSRRACLHEDRLAALVAVAKRIERHFGSHQDVEWAIERRPPAGCTSFSRAP